MLVGASLIFSQTATNPAQKKVTNWGGQAEGPNPKLPPVDPNEKFDPRDFSGVWRPQRDRMMTGWDAVPPRTPLGEKLFQSRVAGRPGPQKQAVEPAKGNDPIMQCNPKGIPRLLFYTGGQAEFHHVPGRILMEFQSQGASRHIWMDGRDLPTNPDGRWMGYSVGRWEGNALVVNTIGFDDRAWLDQWGNVYSKDMKFEERYTRVSRDTIEAVYRLEDPAMYTKPWVSTKKTWLRQASELREELCAPMDEEFFNDNIRDPAGGVTSK